MVLEHRTELYSVSLSPVCKLYHVVTLPYVHTLCKICLKIANYSPDLNSLKYINYVEKFVIQCHHVYSVDLRRLPVGFTLPSNKPLGLVLCPGYFTHNIGLIFATAFYVFIVPYKA